MSNDHAASISASVIRVSQLAADGTIVKGPSASYVTDGFIQLTITPVYEAGTEYTQKNASGAVAATFLTPDTLKHVTVALGITEPDPELTAMLTGQGLITDLSGNSVGWSAAAVGVDSNPNGVAVEIWSNAIVNGRPAAVNPYWQWILPAVKLQLTGNRVIQEGLLATDFTGTGTPNSGFGTGPAAPTWAYISDRAYAYARCATIPSGKGYQAVI